MFDTLLAASDASPGVLVELGAYLGRSAVIIGNHLANHERFVVVDLFGSDAPLGESSADGANRHENTYSYKTLTRQQFEANYLALHAKLPEVVHDLSSAVVDHVEPGTARFVHIDASHLYPQVAEDIRNSKTLLRADGVVVFDDYRAPHTPGVAAAVWEAVANLGLIPFALTARKFYGTFGPAAEHLATVRNLVTGDGRLRFAEQHIGSHAVIRVQPTRPKQSAEPAVLTDDALDKLSERLAQRLAAGLTNDVTSALASTQQTSRRARLVRDFAPPALARAISRRRTQRRR